VVRLKQAQRSATIQNKPVAPASRLSTTMPENDSALRLPATIERRKWRYLLVFKNQNYVACDQCILRLMGAFLGRVEGCNEQNLTTRQLK